MMSDLQNNVINVREEDGTHRRVDLGSDPTLAELSKQFGDRNGNVDMEYVSRCANNRRRDLASKLNTDVESSSEDAERARLEAKYGQVWDTKQLQEDFAVTGFGAPYVVVTRKTDSVVGSLEFQHSPRYYFNFTEN